MIVPSKLSPEAAVVGGIRTDGRKPVVTNLENQGEKVRTRFEVDSDIPVHSEEVSDLIRAAAGETC